MTLTVAATSINASAGSIARLALIILILLCVYGLLCYVKPFAHCHRCHGKGTSPRKASDWLRYRKNMPQRRAPRAAPDCPRCRATGLRLRLGRRAANFLIKRRRQAG